MASFDGHVRCLGQVRKETIASINDKLSSCEYMWSGQETMFATRLPNAQHIVFKFPDNYPYSHVPASYKAPWESWKELLAPIIREIVGNLGLGACETSKVMFTRLNAGAKIATHIDENPSSRVPHKIHVPLMTHPKVIFKIEDKAYHLQVGEAYELNNLLSHSVENDSDTPRIHFIFDCFPVTGSTLNV